jgi:hypothetical protein
MTRRQFLFKRSFTLEQWPAHYDEARQVILDLQTTNTHKLHPIAAYDIHGVPIQTLTIPHNTRRCLGPHGLLHELLASQNRKFLRS